ncbi:MAG: DUF177 domain-containing protein [Acetobacteraceae bacterium]
MELSRPVAVARIGATPLSVEVRANPDECQALALRMRIPAILTLNCAFVLRCEAGGIRADGRLQARVTQVCVVSLDEFEADIAETFAVRFVPEGTETDEIDPEADDEIPYADATVDLGEAAAQQLALALDPYPRKPGVTSVEESPAPSSAFAALKGLPRH